MSEDHSNLDKDYSKRPKKRGGGAPVATGDYKQSKKPQKDYQVYYESKGYDKPNKDQSGPNKGSYNSNYDDYGSKPSRNDRNDRNDRGDRSDNYPPYKPKGTHPRPRRQGPDHVPNVWKKKTNKIPKDAILETFARVGTHSEIEEWLEDYKDLFVREKQPLVNDEVFQLDPNDGLMSKTSRPPQSGPGGNRENDGFPSESIPESTTNTSTTTNATANTNTNANSGSNFQMFDFAQERHDPIAAMRNRLKKDQGRDNENKEEETWGQLNDNDKKGDNKPPKQQFQDDDEELGGLEGEELGRAKDDFRDDDEERYSDVDAKFEEKLKNNEIQETFEDAFDDLLTNNDKKVKLEQMMDDERPEWEDVDTQKVIEDIKKQDFLATLPQDKGVLLNRESGPKSGEKALSTRFSQNVYDDSKDRETGFSSSGFGGIDFSQLSFDLDLQPSADDFPIKQEDLFPSSFTKSMPIKPASHFGQDPMGSLMSNPMSYGLPVMQQGNMMKPIQPTPQMHQLQHMQQMPPMPQHIGHMGPPGPSMPQMPQMSQSQPPMQKMHQMAPGNNPDPNSNANPKYNQYNNQGFLNNQLPPFKREPARETTGGLGFPRHQPNPTLPSFIFKYFSPNYDEKLWYYVDLQKRVQGPFSGKTMDEWYANCHLPLNLNVTIGNNNGYKSLKELAEIIVNRSLQGDNPPPEPKPVQVQAPQPQGFSGISDLLKNRPDLAQSTTPPPQQVTDTGKAKTLDEVEKSGSTPPPYTQYQKYGGSNYPEYGGNAGPNDQGRYNNSKNYQKSGYPQESQSHYQNQPNMAKGPLNQIGAGGYPSDGNLTGNGNNNLKSLSDNIGSDSEGNTSANIGSRNGPSNAQKRSEETQNTNKTAKDTLPQQANPSANIPGTANANPLAALSGSMGAGNPNDMAAQLKNMLGLGGLGGLGGLAGLGGVSTPATEPAQKATLEKQPEKQQEKQQEKPAEKQPEKQSERTQHYQEKQYQEKGQHQEKAHYQEKQYYNNYQHHQEKPEKQERSNAQQLQKKSSKAPKIDTSDFPSLSDSFK